MNTVAAFCEAQGCRHEPIVSLVGWPDEMLVPDMALRLRCSKCGSPKIRMMMDIVALYGKAGDVGSSPFGQ